MTLHQRHTLPICQIYTQILDKVDLHYFVVNQTYSITIRQNNEVSIYIGLIYFNVN